MTASPMNATYSEIPWNASEPDIASIALESVLNASKSGAGTVIATSADGFYSEYVVK